MRIRLRVWCGGRGKYWFPAMGLDLSELFWCVSHRVFRDDSVLLRSDVAALAWNDSLRDWCGGSGKYWFPAKGLDLSVESSSDLPPCIVTDEKRLKKILLNLMGNAVKYTMRGSVKLYIKSTQSQDGCKINFEVKDTGVGIPESEFIRIFELRLLSLAGYQPEFGRCVMCRNEVNGTREHTFSLQRGGLICLECFQGPHNVPRLSGGTIKMLQRAQTIELGKVKRLYFSPQARAESRSILPHFIESRIEKPLKSLKFIEHLAETP